MTHPGQDKTKQGVSFRFTAPEVFFSAHARSRLGRSSKRLVVDQLSHKGRHPEN